MITLTNIQKDFGEGNVLKNINLTFQKGSINVIIGPSGSGKSTLLRTINYLEVPTGGTIDIDGVTLSEKPKTLRHVRKEAPMVFQSFHLFNHLSVLENCTIAQRKVLKRDETTAKNKAIAMLEKVGMDAFINRKPAQLSGGQKQRVSIARALCMDPKILLFDEPTSALDPEMVDDVLHVIKNVLVDNPDLTAVLVTHEMHFAREIATRSIFMDHGEVIEDRNGAALFTNPHQARTKQFLKL